MLRVGRAAVDKATVERRVRVAERLGTQRAPGESSGPPRQRALSFLISSNWAIGEAARLGLPVSTQAVSRQLQHRRVAYGGADLQEIEQATGQTAADVEREVEAELATEAIRRMLDQQASRFTPAEAASYYRRNRSSFVVAEQRVTDLAEDLLTLGVASTLVSRLGTGARFSKRAFRERLTLAAYRRGATDEQKKVLKAVFAAPVGVPSKPMKLGGMWMVFIVRGVIPRHMQSLAAARKGGALSRLQSTRRQAIAERYFKAFRSRWVAETSCSAGYVVPGCAQYSGPTRSEVDPFESG